ncbi:MAG: type IV secretion system DNA-binding domain-containing protein [Clostridia bacterium]|nr:type IV secretion system DNA-binding domain-containing protein [Clostridia bacterium]
MSKNYNRIKKQEGYFFNVLLFLVLFFTLTPVLPIAFVFLLLLYFGKIKTKYALLLSGFGWGALLIQQSILHVFFVEFLYTTKIVFEKIFIAMPFSALLEYRNYTPYSWLVMLLIGFSIAIYFNYVMQKNRKYEQANIHGLEREIDKLELPAPTSEKYSPLDSTFLGLNNARKRIYCKDDCKHVFIAGTTGSGKTVAISNFIYTAVKKDYGCLIVDGKGDITDDSILEITQNLCKEHNKRLYIIDMNNPHSSAKYNPFQDVNDTVIKDMLINLSMWSEEHYKLNTERYLQRLIKLLNLKFDCLDFYKIVEFLPEKQFTALSLSLCTEEKITKDEHIKNIALAEKSGKIAEEASARFATLLESSVGEIFGNGEGINIYQALNEKAVILFVLNPLIYPETSTALGKLALIESKTAVSKMFDNQDRKFFVFDEINTYASTALLNLINKSRSANVTCILAAQSLSDLDSVDDIGNLKNQIIENCNNYLVLRQNTFKSAEEWAKNFGTVERMKMTFQIEETEAVGKGSARKVREFVIHPDEIKSLPSWYAYFVSKDSGAVEKIKVNKPF